MAELKGLAELLKATGATAFKPLPRGRRGGLSGLVDQVFVVTKLEGDDSARIVTMTSPDPQTVKIGKKWVEVLARTANGGEFKPLAVKCQKHEKAYILTAPDAAA